MRTAALLIAAGALAAVATSASAAESFETKACSVHERGHPQAYFKACARTVNPGQILLETPDGRRFSLKNEGRPPLWFINGTLAKQINLTTMTCYENSLISICFQGGLGF